MEARVGIGLARQIENSQVIHSAGRLRRMRRTNSDSEEQIRTKWFCVLYVGRKPMRARTTMSGMEIRSTLCRICGEVLPAESAGTKLIGEGRLCEPCAVKSAEARARIRKLEEKAL